MIFLKDNTFLIAKTNNNKYSNLKYIQAKLAHENETAFTLSSQKSFLH